MRLTHLVLAGFWAAMTVLTVCTLPSEARIVPSSSSGNSIEAQHRRAAFSHHQLEARQVQQAPASTSGPVQLSGQLVGSLINQKLTPKIAQTVQKGSLTQPKTYEQNVPWKETGTRAKTADYTLDPHWDAHAPPQVRELTWTITRADAAPDGYSRQVISINGQYPGPLVETNEGDTLVVHVTNQLDELASVHWHGMNQNMTIFADGVPGFSQCPIPPGVTYTYRFKLEQWGTYWYHSHSSVQYIEGLHGPLVIHSRREAYQRGRDYDDEVLLFLYDWYHERTEVIAQALNSTKGYNHFLAAPPPQSSLVNGRGHFDCSKQVLSQTPQTYSCVTPRLMPSLTLEPNKRYRFRMVNSGGHAMYHVTMDRHQFRLVATDGVDIRPSTQSIIPINIGQRYDAIVHTDQGGRGKGKTKSSSFWLRSRTQRICLAYDDAAADAEARVAVYYADPPAQGKAITKAAVVTDGIDKPEPTTTPIVDVLGPTCRDLDDHALVPVESLTKPNHEMRNVRSFATNFGVLTAMGDHALLGRFFVNGVTARNHPYKPFLRDLHEGRNVSGDVAFAEFLDDVWVGDIIINNNDTAIVHPYHLHGRYFNIVARGPGVMTPEKWRNLDTSSATVPRRDTISIASNSYAVLRLLTDTPGVWPMHCHITWHLAQGFLAAALVHPNKLREPWAWPKESEDLCRAAKEPEDTETLA